MEQAERQLRVNGSVITTEAQTVSRLLATLGVDETRPGVAVALNEEIVLRSEWPATELQDGDTVEILTATQGG